MAPQQFPCLHCNTVIPYEADICPECGEPQERAREAMQRTASMTGIPYEDLLQQARNQNLPPSEPSE